MIERGALESALKDFLPRQRWFRAGGEVGPISITDYAVLKDDWPAMIRIVLETGSGERYHVPIGVRPLGEEAVYLQGHPESVLGQFQSDIGPGFAYDAVRDPDLSLFLFEWVAPELPTPKLVRPMGAEQTNTSLVFDDSFVLKVFRVISAGVSLDVEVTRALTESGFPHVAPVLATWSESGSDLAVVQQFLPGGSEAWSLALTSVRDLLGSGGDPSLAGGDFSAEAERLGQMTAEMHRALAESFGMTRGDPGKWADLMMYQLDRVDHERIDRKAAERVFEDLRAVEDPGVMIRVHGDFHLGQVLRTDAGWFVLDFEGEPVRPIEERRMPSSPFKDVAGMARSFQYASRSPILEDRTENLDLVRSWEARNRQAFIDGYVAAANEIGGLLPGDRRSMDRIIRAFEVDKAIYEVGYELAHRPEWVEIPLEALDGMLG